MKCALESQFEKINRIIEEPVNIYFSNWLVDDLIKLRLSLSKDPDVVTYHLFGIYILVVPTVTIIERTPKDKKSNM